ncbi:MAG: hypothetical protein M1816_003746 [Peltula sp. TS41687]|nr:MAG: hypothetical protein M1816_003746 [Peltula sp. TS41687]
METELKRIITTVSRSARNQERHGQDSETKKRFIGKAKESKAKYRKTNRDPPTHLTRCRDRHGKNTMRGERALENQRRVLETGQRDDAQQEDREIEQRLQDTETELEALDEQTKRAKNKAKWARIEIKANENSIENLPTRLKSLEARLQKLKKQLKGLQRKHNISPEPGPDSVAEDRPEQDQNRFSMAGIENGARRWMQGVGSVIQNVNRQLSTGGASADLHYQPSLGGLPKLGPVGVP